MFKKKSWYRKKKFAHFDVPLDKKSASLFVSNAKNISRHAFFPFVEFDIISRRYRTEKVESNGKIVKRRKPVEPKKRPIKLCSHKDGYVYSYYGMLISRCYEDFIRKKYFNDNVIAYRPGKGTNFTNSIAAFDFIKKIGPCKIFTLDISGFFENIDHKVLKEKWCEVLGVDRLPADHYNIYKSLTRYSKIRLSDLCDFLEINNNDVLSGKIDRICEIFVFRNMIRKKVPSIIDVNDSNRGIPQGTSMSSVLSNIYMIGFDEDISKFCKNNNILYRRYCDDVIFIQPAESVVDIMKFAKDKLYETGKNLEIKEEKTERYFFDGKVVHSRPVQYLGLTFDGKNIRIRNGSLAKFHRKMKAAVGYRKFKAKNRTGELRGVLILKSLYRKYTWKIDYMSFHGYASRVGKVSKDDAVKCQLRRSQNQLEKLLKS